jgi:hypothetical protein
MPVHVFLPGFTAECALGRAGHSYGYSMNRYQSTPKGAATMELQQTTTQPVNDAQIDASPSGGRMMESLIPQQADQPCSTCGSQARSGANGAFTPGFVYALGKIEARFPTLGVEKEFAQATSLHATSGLTDRQAFHDVLKRNRYLARQLCWVFSVGGLPTYILQSRDPFDFELLLESLRREPSATDIDVVIGVRGPIAPPEICNGLMIPIVLFDQLYSFDHSSFLGAVPRPARVSRNEFEPVADELLDRIVQLSDNAGATDDHRALNYLAVRYAGIYATAFDAIAQNKSLRGVEVQPSRLSGTRKIVDAIFTFTHRQTDVTEKHFVRVDVTEEFPFLVTKMSDYYDR